ncbi:MAG: hypothetical protein K0U62_11480 [Actinomycetia bacterium]|nr:hypothetical protein [Actinomycetes bacterium]
MNIFEKVDVWYQVSGDVGASTYGVTLARMDDGGNVELLEIQPVREFVGDRDAREVGYPYWSKEAYLWADDEREDFNAANLEELLFEGRVPWEEGRSGWSKDVLPGGSVRGIEWWTPQGHSWRSEDAEFRREILGD